MMFFCPVCGRRRFVHQPQFWPYRFDGEMFCSENCWICDATKKTMERKGFKMARMKKDGTPAKKPGPRAKKKEIPEQLPEVKLTGPIRIETPEAEKVQVVEMPEITEEDIQAVNEKIRKNKSIKPIYFEGYTVRCIEGVMGRFYYDTQFDRLDWTTPEGDEVSFSPSAWKRFATEELPKVMALLGVKV